MNVAIRHALDNSMPLVELCYGCPPNSFGRICAQLLLARMSAAGASGADPALPDAGASAAEPALPDAAASGAEPALPDAAASGAEPALPDAAASTADPALSVPADPVRARCLLDTCDPDHQDLNVNTGLLFQGWVGVSRVRLLGLVDSRYTGRGNYCFMVQSSDKLHQIAFGDMFEAQDSKNKKVYQHTPI